MNEPWRACFVPWEIESLAEEDVEKEEKEEEEEDKAKRLRKVHAE